MASKLLVEADKAMKTCCSRLEKWHPCYALKKQLAKLSSLVTSKIENKPNEIVDLGKMISRQNVGSVNWLILADYIKCRKREMS